MFIIWTSYTVYRKNHYTEIFLQSLLDFEFIFSLPLSYIETKLKHRENDNDWYVTEWNDMDDPWILWLELFVFGAVNKGFEMKFETYSIWCFIEKNGPPILKKKLCCLNSDGYCDREYIREYPIECGFAWGVGLHIQNELKRNMVGSSCIATPHHRRHSPSANAINYLSNVSCDAVTFAKWFDFVNKSLIIWLSILYYWESLQNCISRSGKSIMLIEFDKKASVCC